MIEPSICIVHVPGHGNIKFHHNESQAYSIWMACRMFLFLPCPSFSLGSHTGTATPPRTSLRLTESVGPVDGRRAVVNSVSN